MANQNPIIESLKKELKNFKSESSFQTVGHVEEVFDGIVRVSGLLDVRASEMVTFPNGAVGVALNLETDTVGVIVLGEYKGIKERIAFALKPLKALVKSLCDVLNMKRIRELPILFARSLKRG